MTWQSRARVAILYLRNRWAERSRALAASTSRYFGGALVSRELRRLLDTAVIPSTAARKAASFAFDGLLKPLTLRTNCRAAARISSSVTGGAKLNRILMFRHISVCLDGLGLAKAAGGQRTAALSAAKASSSMTSLELPAGFENHIHVLCSLPQSDGGTVGKSAGRANGERIGGQARRFGRRAALFSQICQANERQRLVRCINLAKRLGFVSGAQAVQQRH